MNRVIFTHLLNELIRILLFFFIIISGLFPAIDNIQLRISVIRKHLIDLTDNIGIIVQFIIIRIMSAVIVKDSHDDLISAAAVIQFQHIVEPESLI